MSMNQMGDLATIAPTVGHVGCGLSQGGRGPRLEHGAQLPAIHPPLGILLELQLNEAAEQGVDAVVLSVGQVVDIDRSGLFVRFVFLGFDWLNRGMDDRQLLVDELERGGEVGDGRGAQLASVAGLD